MTRQYTFTEREEIYDFCFRGRLGHLSYWQQDYIAKLYRINPKEYAKIHKQARQAADSLINPLSKEKS